MSTRFRGQPPRVLLHQKDHATGSYPSIVRTGSGKNRLGTNKIFYDDNKTFAFVNYPIGSVGDFTTVEDPITNFHQNEEYSGSLVAYWNFDQAGSTVTFNAPEYAVFHPDLYTGSLDLTSSRNDPVASVFSTSIPKDLDVNNSLEYQFELVESTNGFPTNYFKSWVVGAGLANFSFGDGTDDSPFSVSLWFKRNVAMDYADDVTGAAIQPPIVIPRQCLVSKSGSVGKEWVIRFEQGEGGDAGVKFLILDDSTGASKGKLFKYLTTVDPQRDDQAPGLGKWMHLGVSYDGSGTSDGINAYIDGNLFNSISSINDGAYTAMESTGQALVVGAADNLFLSGAATSSHEEPCGSNITDVAIFNTELSLQDFRKISAIKRGISAPSGLPNGSPFLTEDLKTTMILDSNLKKQNISEFLHIPNKLFDDRSNILSELESLELKPFNEDFRPEQSVETDFFLTGSKESETTLGFSSRLGDKISLSRKFKINSSFVIPSLTASILYFNPISGSFFNVVPADERQDPSTTTVNAWFHDAKLFSPFGTFCLTGALTSETRFSHLHEYLFKEGSRGEQEDVAKLLSLGHENHLLATSSYSPSNDGRTPQFFEIDDIEHSFLLEKVVIELPLSASPDWINDQTKIHMSDAIGIPGEDVGGPCITVALLRNNSINNTRELICSGTIIPVGDNVSFSRTTNFNSQKAPSGFLSFSTPTTVVTPNGDDFFVGKVQLNMVPAITNGFIKRGAQGSSNDVLKQLSPFGRSGETKPVGRSFFGKEFSTNNLDNNDNIHYDLSDVEDSNSVFMGNKNFASPYLLEKGDQIILSVSKFRPVITEGTVASTRDALVTTHTVEIPTGEINIRLYGSTLRNGQENNNDFLNQGLTSLAIHEDVHGHNPITDQLDICPITDLTGTYVDHYITGTTDLLPPVSSSNTTFINEFNSDAGEGAYTARVRGVVRSTLSTNIGNKTYTTQAKAATAITRRYWVNHMIRNVSMFTADVRFLDTLMPKFDDIYKKQIDGGDVLFDVGGFAEYAFSENPDASEVRDWLYQFPYEPIHAEIPRLTNFSKNIKAVDTGTGDDKIVSEVQVEHGEVELFDNPRNRSTGASTIKVASTDREILSAVFGFHNHFGLSNFSNDYSKRSPLLVGKAEPGQFVQVRGFKYGINHIGAIGPRYTFRRDRFGQMRDMLEQGLNTAVYSDNRSQFTTPPVRATFARTDQSSNLSSFCTSSLPFFDGISRNTPEEEEGQEV